MWLAVSWSESELEMSTALQWEHRWVFSRAIGLDFDSESEWVFRSVSCSEIETVLSMVKNSETTSERHRGT